MKKENIQFEVRNQDISSTLFLPNSKNKEFPVVIFAHERKADKSKYFPTAEEVADEGIAVLVFDFRGHGDSEGSLGKQTLRDGLKDIRAAYEVVEEHDNLDEETLGLAGRRFGGYLSALFTEEVEVSSLVLASPAVYKDEWIDLMYRNFPLKDVKEFRSQIDFTQTRSVKAIQEYSGDLLVVGKGGEEKDPETVLNAYYENATSVGTKELEFIELEEGKLDEDEYMDKFNEIVSDWFSTSL